MDRTSPEISPLSRRSLFKGAVVLGATAGAIENIGRCAFKLQVEGSYFLQAPAVSPG